MTLSRRLTDDPAPTLSVFGRALARRAVPAAVGLFLAGLAIGWVISGPVGLSLGEDRLSVLIQSGRTPGLDTLALTASAIGSVAGNAILCVVSVALVWVLTRRWWLSALPAVALTLHVVVHFTTSTLVARPRPEVERLDIGQPTASFPSGHVGATTAQLLVLVLVLFLRVKSGLWRTVVVAAVTGFLIVLGWSRVYLGMHHVTDVVWGAVNGVACGLIAWWFLRSRPPAEPAGGPASATSGPGALD